MQLPCEPQTGVKYTVKKSVQIGETFLIYLNNLNSADTLISFNSPLIGLPTKINPLKCAQASHGEPVQ